MIIKPHNIRYRLAIWKTPTGEYLKGQLPTQIRERGHFGVSLRSYLLYQHHHCHVTQPLLLEQIHELGIDISAGQLNRILVSDKDCYHTEKREILQIGLLGSSYINTDDTSARHQGINSYCTHQIFTTTTQFETLNQVLKRLYQRKSELLRVLSRPELPLHNNEA